MYIEQCTAVVLRSRKVTSRYACSGFSLVEFYLVTVLEKANVALPPLEVTQIVIMVINTIKVVTLDCYLNALWGS